MSAPTPPELPSFTNKTTFFALAQGLFVWLTTTFMQWVDATATAMNLNSTNDLSTSSVLIGSGSKSFTVSLNKSFLPGMWIIMADTAAPGTNSMVGQITSYTIGTGALVVSVPTNGFLGSGTKAAWTISQTAKPSGEISGAMLPVVQAATTSLGRVALDAPSTADIGLKSIDYALSAGALTLKVNPSISSFRSATLTDGAPVSVANAAQITTTISSGSTAGTVSGQQSDIIVLEINNAGTKEVAWTNAAGGLTLDGSGLINTVAEGGAGAADSANVIYSNTARTGVAYRVVGVVRSTQTTAGTWAQTPVLVQGAGAGVDIQPAKSMIRLNTANGYGSTNTAIRRFTNTVVSQGADVTYADSATLGATLTVNKAGVYGLSYSDNFNTASDFCISLNSTVLNTFPTTQSELLVASTTSVASYRATCATTVVLKAGDVIRAHASGAPVGASANTFFTMTRIS